MSSHRDCFYKQLDVYYSEKSRKKPWSQLELEEYITHLQEAKSTKTGKTQNQYRLLRTYDLIEVSGTVCMILKAKTENVIYVVAYENIFEKLKEIHESTGHGGRDKIEFAIKNKYQIPRPAISTFLSTCDVCKTKKPIPHKGVVVKPIVSKGFNARGQVDLIDFQTTPDNGYKWVLHYQDHATKFSQLRPLISKRAAGVAVELLKIFLEQGAPQILQSDNGREFVAEIVRELIDLWPGCKIINGRPRHPQSQGSVERANQDVEIMLRAWLVDNNSTRWSTGLYFVQWQKNTSLHRTIGRSPYQAVYGCEPRVGISSDIPGDLLGELHDEEDILLEEPNHELIEEEHQRNSPCSSCGVEIRGECTETEPTVCEYCVRERNIASIQDDCHNKQKHAASKMMASSSRLHKTIEIGANVVVSVPKVDRGPLDGRTVRGVVLDVKDSSFKVGTAAGVLKNWCGRDQITTVSGELTEGDVPLSKTISIREAVSFFSMYDGQGHSKCNCKSLSKKCETAKCVCFKKKLKCSSKCHGSSACSNK